MDYTNDDAVLDPLAEEAVEEIVEGEETDAEDEGAYSVYDVGADGEIEEAL